MIQTLGLSKLQHVSPLPTRRVYVRYTQDRNDSKNQIEIFRTPPGMYLYLTAASITRLALSGGLRLSLEFLPLAFITSNLISSSNYKPGGAVFLDAQNAFVGQNLSVFLKRSLIIPEMCVIRLNMSSSGFNPYDPMVSIDGFLFENHVRFPGLTL